MSNILNCLEDTQTLEKVYLKVDMIWVKYGLGFGKEFHKYNFRVSCLTSGFYRGGRETGRAHSDFLGDITHLLSPIY